MNEEAVHGLTAACRESACSVSSGLKSKGPTLPYCSLLYTADALGLEQIPASHMCWHTLKRFGTNAATGGAGHCRRVLQAHHHCPVSATRTVQACKLTRFIWTASCLGYVEV